LLAPGGDPLRQGCGYLSRGAFGVHDQRGSVTQGVKQCGLKRCWGVRDLYWCRSDAIEALDDLH
jgi:hypothetical protein